MPRQWREGAKIPDIDHAFKLKLENSLKNHIKPLTQKNLPETDQRFPWFLYSGELISAFVRGPEYFEMYPVSELQKALDKLDRKLVAVVNEIDRLPNYVSAALANASFDKIGSTGMIPGSVLFEGHIECMQRIIHQVRIETGELPRKGNHHYQAAALADACRTIWEREIRTPPKRVSDEDSRKEAEINDPSLGKFGDFCREVLNHFGLNNHVNSALRSADNLRKKNS